MKLSDSSCAWFSLSFFKRCFKLDNAVVAFYLYPMTHLVHILNILSQINFKNLSNKKKYNDNFCTINVIITKQTKIKNKKFFYFNFQKGIYPNQQNLT